MRIGIDYWPATTHAPGVGRYVRELVRALVRREDAPWLGLYDVGPGPRDIPADALGLPADSARVHRRRSSAPRRVAEWVGGGADRQLGGCDLFHQAFHDRPKVGRAKRAITLAEIPAPGHARHDEVRAAARAFDGVIVACESARATALERLALDPERVHVVPVGCEHWMRSLGRAPSQPDGPPHRIVALGRVDRGRHSVELLRATAALSERGRAVELVFAGRPGDAADELRAAIAGARVPVRWIEAPREAELPALVGGAAVLAHIEPEVHTAVTPLEALAAGAAVVAARLAPFVEALGEHAEWVDTAPTQADLEGALERALDSALDPRARAARASLAAGYTWHRAAGLTTEAWRRILDQPSRS